MKQNEYKSIKKYDIKIYDTIIIFIPYHISYERTYDNMI